MLGTSNRGRNLNQNQNRIQNGMHELGFEIVELEIEGYLWEVACRKVKNKEDKRARIANVDSFWVLLRR